MDISNIIECIEQKKKESGRLIVAIDGRCGSGKSTLGQLLSDRFNCTLFHMDDFFLRAEQRTAERLSTPGGNVDYERFLSDVLLPVSNGQPVMLRKIIHGSFTLTEPEEIIPANLVIVEGSYSCHPELRQYYDLRIFVTTERDTQLERILKRNGPEKYPLFVSKWIPMEELYFSKMNVEETCHITYET